MRVAFVHGRLEVDAATITLLEFAVHNETLLGNTSVVFFEDFTSEAKTEAEINEELLHFAQSRVKCIGYKHQDELKKLIDAMKMDAIYSLAEGPLPAAAMPTLGGSAGIHIQHSFFRSQSKRLHKALQAPKEIHANLSLDVERMSVLTEKAARQDVSLVRDFPITSSNCAFQCAVIPMIVPASSWRLRETWSASDSKPTAGEPLGAQFRAQLGIPKDAIVIGRHGGLHTFDLGWVKDTVTELVHSEPGVWFVFMNTEPFVDHQRVIFTEACVLRKSKAAFMDACDAMLHAHALGEALGLACAEFSSMGKPVMTLAPERLGPLSLRLDVPEEAAARDIQNVRRNHLEILGGKALVFSHGEGLKDLILHIQKTAKCRTREGWNACQELVPARVMSLFQRVLLQQTQTPATHSVVQHTCRHLLSLTPCDVTLLYPADASVMEPWIRAVVETVADVLETAGWPVSVLTCEQKRQELASKQKEKWKSTLRSCQAKYPQMDVWFGDWYSASGRNQFPPARKEGEAGELNHYALFNVLGAVPDDLDAALLAGACQIFDFSEANRVAWKIQYNIAPERVTLVDLCVASENPTTKDETSESLLAQSSASSDRAPPPESPLLYSEAKVHTPHTGGLVIVLDDQVSSAMEVVQVARAISRGWRVLCGGTFLRAFPEFCTFVVTSESRFNTENFTLVKESATRIPHDLTRQLAADFAHKRHERQLSRHELFNTLNLISDKLGHTPAHHAFAALRQSSVNTQKHLADPLLPTEAAKSSMDGGKSSTPSTLACPDSAPRFLPVTESLCLSLQSASSENKSSGNNWTSEPLPDLKNITPARLMRQTRQM